PRPASVASPSSPGSDRGSESIGSFLKHQRELKSMSVAEVSRATRIPVATLESIESDHFDDLPGEVFVRGFLKSYAQAVGVLPAEVLARYTASRRVVFVTPLPSPSTIASSSGRNGGTRRFGVAIAFVLLLILFTLALSIVLKPRGHDMPSELSFAVTSVDGIV
ncbi:MAG: 4Fe-4S ferredoxin, iron-sulfur binding protein, partial [Myxococcaceae bacterium]|nr:4Fe-4S ferredoxin, iron-sulfur binding protein [Myxococcaceae bacterium]